MVLIWGLLQDSPTLFVYNALLRLKADVYFLDHSKISDTSIFFTSTTHGYSLKLRNEYLNLDTCKSAYLRPYDISKYPGFAESRDSNLHSKANLFHLLMNNWAEYTTIPIINKPSASATNNSKLLQSITIQKCGFLIPPSLVSNNKENINSFLKQQKRVIYNSMSGVRSVVEEYFPNQLEDMTLLGLMFFQKYIEGDNIRVHVIGDRVFATIIRTCGIDYRYAESSLNTFSLPSEIAVKCINCNKQLGLLLSGIDLIRTANNEWYCLEVNTNPGFTYFDREEGNPIAMAIAEFLYQG